MSKERFEVGEIAIVIDEDFKRYREYIGTEVTILSPLAPHPFIGVNMRVHKVKMCDGRVLYATPSCLRKKKPPREDLQVVRWADCPWQPEKVTP